MACKGHLTNSSEFESFVTLHQKSLLHQNSCFCAKSPSVLVLFRWEGNPDELLAAYDRELEHPVPASSLSAYLTPVREPTMA